MVSSVQSAAQTESLFYCYHHEAANPNIKEPKLNAGTSKGLLENKWNSLQLIFLIRRSKDRSSQKKPTPTVDDRQDVKLGFLVLQSRYNNMKILQRLQLSDSSLDLYSHKMLLIKKTTTTTKGHPPPKKKHWFEYLHILKIMKI